MGGYVKITKVVVINYGENGKPNIQEYGYRVKEVSTGEVYYPTNNTPIYGTIGKMDEGFYYEIMRTANNHLNSDYFVDWIYPEKPKLIYGAPEN